MSERKLLVIPVTVGQVTFKTDHCISVESDSGRIDIKSENRVGPDIQKNEMVAVIDIQELADALREAYKPAKAAG